MNQDIWRHVSPLFSQYAQQIEQYPTLEPSDFFACQPRLIAALERLCNAQGLSRSLIINAPDNAIYRELIIKQLETLSNSPVVSSENLASTEPFTQIQVVNGEIIKEFPGLLDKANGGYLVISPSWLLANPKMWPLLKAALLAQPIQAINCDGKSPALNNVAKSYDVKLVIVGDREQLANLEYLDNDFTSGFSLFSELELELKLEEHSVFDYLRYLKWFCQQYKFPELTSTGINTLMSYGVRNTEDQQYVPLCLFWLHQTLEEAAALSNGSTLDHHAIQTSIDNKYYRESYLPERASTDILDGQVVIETSGKQVGQVNGLTVIDIAGHPISYGEPARISCVIHFGDGDITDVERKAELGGNLHAKGMMIMQAFVSSALDLNEPLPYAASIVFEQSYSEVDGDSASLAEVTSLVSALSGIEVKQEIAVTGAVDQSGRVQAVGGLNEKIEGFYKVCLHQGLTGQQGVVLPKSNLRNLALHHSVVESIKSGMFHIYPVETVDEAIPLLMEQPFRGENSVIDKIAERIDEIERNHAPLTMWQKLKSIFFSY
ncbi:S16 family serine protease [Vibrio sp. WJH972]